MHKIQPTIILQPFGHVDGLNVSRLLEWPHIQNELVGYKTCSDQHQGEHFKLPHKLILLLRSINYLKDIPGSVASTSTQNECFHNRTFPASVEDLKVTLQPLGHVVGIEDGHLCSVKQPFGSHHLNTGVMLGVMKYRVSFKIDNQNRHWKY